MSVWMCVCIYFRFFSVYTYYIYVFFQGTRQPITSEILKATTNEDGDEITYSVLRAPRLGRLISANHKNQFQEISTFTQAEVSASVCKRPQNYIRILCRILRASM